MRTNEDHICQALYDQSYNSSRARKLGGDDDDYNNQSFNSCLYCNRQKRGGGRGKKARPQNAFLAMKC